MTLFRVFISKQFLYEENYKINGIGIGGIG
jgi:hypothetical protein